jgi:hypothetical protein
MHTLTALYSLSFLCALSFLSTFTTHTTTTRSIRIVRETRRKSSFGEEVKCLFAQKCRVGSRKYPSTRASFLLKNLRNLTASALIRLFAAVWRSTHSRRNDKQHRISKPVTQKNNHQFNVLQNVVPNRVQGLK